MPRATSLDRAGRTVSADPFQQAVDLFVEHWGEMAGRWGIPKTMGQLHALLYATGQTLCVQEIMDRLGVSRGNVSMTLRELMTWGLVHKVQKPGERRDYFQAEHDVWKIFRTIIQERKRREIDPTVEGVRQCQELIAQAAPSEAARAFHTRLEQLGEFLALLDTFVRLVAPAGSADAARLLDLFTSKKP